MVWTRTRRRLPRPLPGHVGSMARSGYRTGLLQSPKEDSLFPKRSRRIRAGVPSSQYLRPWRRVMSDLSLSAHSEIDTEALPENFNRSREEKLIGMQLRGAPKSVEI